MNSQRSTELRQANTPHVAALKRVINHLQAETLSTLERFGWGIRFLRALPGGDALAVVYDPDHRAYAVIEPDGVLVKNPAMQFR